MLEGIMIDEMAGYCSKGAICRMMTDICAWAEKNGACIVTPQMVVCRRTAFSVMAEHGEEIDTRFCPPEVLDGSSIGDAQMAWSIGALVHFATTGQVLFGGRGSSVQHQNPEAMIPELPKTFQAVSPIVRACLNHNPHERPDLKTIQSAAEECSRKVEKRKTTQTYNIGQVETNHPITSHDEWPELMA